MSIAPNARFTVPDHVLVRELGGESVLLNLDSETYFGLDETGTRFWQALTSYPSLAEACRALHGEYEVDRGRLDRDVAGLARALVERGLLVALGEAPWIPSMEDSRP